MDWNCVFRHRHRSHDILVSCVLGLGIAHELEVESSCNGCVRYPSTVSLQAHIPHYASVSNKHPRTVIFSGLHVRSIIKEIASSDPSLSGAVTLAWRQFELDFAIVACTFSSLGAFLKPFDKEMGPSRTDSHHIGSGRRFPMSNNRSGNHSGHDTKPGSSGSIDLPILRPDRGQTTAAIMSTSAPSDRLSVESNDSKKGIIMKKQWAVQDDAQR